MMENSRYNLHDDKRFKDELDECYFHPSRKYASEEIKFIARNAMLLLWDMDGISVQGVHFSKSDIRYRMLHEMSCDDLDRAIAEASAKNWNMKFVDFLVLILWHILFGKRLVEIQIEQSLADTLPNGGVVDMLYYGQKREPRENYFPVHNRIFDLGLCAEELAIYLYLVRCEDKKTYTCYPSHATIGSCIGRTANTVQKYVKELEKKRLITTELTMVRAKNGRFCNGSLRYTIRPIQDAIDYYDEQQMRKLQAEMARRNAEKALERFDEKHRNRAV